MISTEDMLNEIIEKNLEFNAILDANQKGYEVRYVETNNPSQFANYPGFKVISEDDLFTKVRFFLRTNPLMPTRLKEKPRDINKEHYLQISYKNGKGGMVINTNNITKAQLNKILKTIQNL